MVRLVRLVRLVRFFMLPFKNVASQAIVYNFYLLRRWSFTKYFFQFCQTFPDFLKMKYDSNTHFKIKQIKARFAQLTSKKFFFLIFLHYYLEFKRSKINTSQPLILNTMKNVYLIRKLILTHPKYLRFFPTDFSQSAKQSKILLLRLFGEVTHCWCYCKMCCF